MENQWDAIRLAVVQAKDQIKAVNDTKSDMAYLLVGNLRGVSQWTLAKLKKELRDYNINTGKWSNEK